MSIAFTQNFEEFTMGLYENIKIAAKQKGYSINKLEQELGFPRSSISKFNKNTPSTEKIEQISNFLGISTNYLIKGADSELNAKDKKDISKALNETILQLENQDGLMFDGEIIDDETRELLRISLENTIRTAKVTAKKKFTPKKYRTDN